MNRPVTALGHLDICDGELVSGLPLDPMKFKYIASGLDGHDAAAWKRPPGGSDHRNRSDPAIYGTWLG
jgi:hypothetical protein